MRSRTFPLGLLLELPNCTPIPVSALLWLLHKVHPPALGTLMLHSLKPRESVRYSGNLMTPFLSLLSLFNNPLFLPCSKPPESFFWWSSHGFTKVHHLLMFLLLVLIPGNSRGTTHWVLSLRPTMPLGDLSEMEFYLPFKKKAFEHTCLHFPGSTGTIKRIYATHKTIYSPAVASFKSWWERDLNWSGVK